MTGQKSHCLDDDNYPVIDTYIYLQDVYNQRLEDDNMVFQKGIIPWNKGSKGILTAWNKGIPCREETKVKLSIINQGRIPPNPFPKGVHISPDTEFKKGQVSIRKGITLPKEQCKRLAEINKVKCMGVGNPFYGKKHSLESKKKMSISHKGCVAWNKDKEGLCGDKNPMWEGGISFLPYCPKFNKVLKEQIRERDNRTCQLCGTKENGTKLDVHHIHYDKENCEPDLIALCRCCNSKVNGNREYWELIFIEKLKSRGLLL